MTDGRLGMAVPPELGVPWMFVATATGVTVCGTAVDAGLARKRASPLYVAVIECDEPTVSVLVGKAAVLPVSATVPSTMAPSRNVTSPVGVEAAVTVAVKTRF